MWLVQDFCQWNPRPYPGLDINVKEGVRELALLVYSNWCKVSSINSTRQHRHIEIWRSF